MLMVISPAKSLDYETRIPSKKWSLPTLLEDSEQLISVMREKSPAQLQQLMGISESLAELNHERYLDWTLPFNVHNARPAVFAFAGDVYQGLDAYSLGERDFTHAQKTLRILSGLYGALRPLDLIQPYRLEMGTKLRTERGRNLVDFWGPTITNELNLAIENSPGNRVLVNLASQEYFASVDPRRLNVPIVSPVFLDMDRSGTPRVISFFAKRARGLMARWMIRERVTRLRDLTDFHEAGYRYAGEQSSSDRPVFVRSSAAIPLR